MKYMILILNIKQTELLSLLPEMENEKKEKKKVKAPFQYLSASGSVPSFPRKINNDTGHKPASSPMYFKYMTSRCTGI